MQRVIKIHLSRLKNKLLHFFSPSNDIRKKNMWILNLILSYEKHKLFLLNENQIIELSSKKIINSYFKTKN